MPLDIAMQNTQQKPTNVDNTNYLLCVGAVTIATAFLTIFSRNQSTVPYILSFVFTIAGHYLLLNSQFLIVHIIVYSGAIMILFYSPSC
jgi:NADH:ubiquinone oxidoreductase subunit 6 (subunit J)